MITNFEDYTYELTDKEVTFLINITTHLRKKIGISNIITSTKICKIYKEKGFNLTPSRFRKIIHEIRVKGFIPNLIATSKGYYVAETVIELENYLESLEQRISSIQEIANQITFQIKVYKNNR